MICHEYRCIFIHVRKAAGRSIRWAFGETKYESGRHYIEGVLSPRWHKRPKDYFVFASIRNPFDRLVSGYSHFLAHSVSFEEALRNPPKDVVPKIGKRDGIEYRHFTRPQVDLIRHKTGKLVTDDLIRFESLQADFDRICDKIGKPRMALPVLGVSRRESREYRSYYNAETRKLAEKLVAPDLEAFGYEF